MTSAPLPRHEKWPKLGSVWCFCDMFSQSAIRVLSSFKIKLGQDVSQVLRGFLRLDTKALIGSLSEKLGFCQFLQKCVIINQKISINKGLKLSNLVLL